jgi:copper oxidase (laccase) domain-containing protein
MVYEARLLLEARLAYFGAMEIETFPALRLPGLRHGFTTRSSGELAQLEGEMQASYDALGFPIARAAWGEQPHGNNVAAVSAPGRVAGVDALSTATVGLPLLVRVADCGPVYFYDPVRRVIALAHSGRRGTEGNIVGATISHLVETYGTKPADLIVELGPCIRPPHYEVDFASEIGQQAKYAGVTHYHDLGSCTASDLGRYYSYRAEKAKTGRMWAILMLD